MGFLAVSTGTADLVYPWQLRQGSDFAFGPVTWSTGAPVALVNLTGCTATAMVRQVATDSSPLVSISTTPNAQGAIVLGGAAGTVTVVIYRACTLALPAGAAGGAAAVDGLWLQWDLDILFPPNSLFPAGQNWPWGRGPVWVTAAINR
jgi:hypothetical protein